MCTYKKDGKGSELSNCNGIDAAQGCTMKFMTHEAGLYGSDSGKGANWHPTRAFHMLRGEAIAWLHSLILLECTYILEKDLTSGETSSSALLETYTDKLASLQPPLKKAEKCTKYLCEYKPQCFTDYRPHYSPDTLSSIMVGNSNWTYEPEILGDWSLHYGYLDAKPLYYASGVTVGTINVKVNVDKIGTVWLCGAVKESLLNSTIYVDNITDLKLANVSSDYVPTGKRVQWTKQKYVGSECKELTGLTRGQYVISIAPNSYKADHKTALSHVVTW